jgi:3-deoxy-7-phosphoheptulonate synthase
MWVAHMDTFFLCEHPTGRYKQLNLCLRQEEMRMILVMKPQTSEKDKMDLIDSLMQLGFSIHESDGVNYTVIGIIGDTSSLDQKMFLANECIDKVIRVQEPFKLANRMFHPENTIVDVKGVKVGGRKITVIAGPCSIETREQIFSVAASVKDAGASMLRGGAFKPRTSPYSFQGLRESGLELLKEAGEKTDMPIVTEIMSADKIELFIETVDVIQVGARNMQNFELLKELGKTRKPILLKRGLSSTIEEWIMSAEYIMAGGNENVMLCERGIRTFETYTRNTLDLSAVMAAKKLSHLPVFVDPSHATGKWWMVENLAMAAVAAGCDGLMIEVHNDPAHALCDGDQSLKPERFEALMKPLRAIAAAIDREI